MHFCKICVCVLGDFLGGGGEFGILEDPLGYSWNQHYFGVTSYTQDD